MIWLIHTHTPANMMRQIRYLFLLQQIRQTDGATDAQPPTETRDRGARKNETETFRYSK